MCSLQVGFCFLLCYQLSFVCCLNINVFDILNGLSTEYKHATNQLSSLFDVKNDGVDPDVCMNVSELITSKGYPCEDHVIQTEDGFLLGVQRIPHGKLPSQRKQSNYNRRHKPVVFLQHGLLASSSNWVANLANESLGFLLADAGFDVWLGNSRGNTYSRRHVTLSPHQKEFWRWSWDEMAKYDLPGVIEYILNTTRNKKLFYIGHSQGTLQAFAAFSQNSAVASKVKLYIALAPVAALGHLKSPITVFSDIPDQLVFDIFGRGDFLPNNWLFKLLGSTLCKSEITSPVCTNILFLISGYDMKNLNVSRIPVYVAHAPAGTSVQNMVHFSQMSRSHLFQAYDYDCPEINKKHYNQTTAPLYDLRKMKVPTIVYSGSNDWLAIPKDVAKIKSQLPNLKESHEIKNWNHLDFIWGVDAADVMYYNIIKDLKKAAGI